MEIKYHVSSNVQATAYDAKSELLYVAYRSDSQRTYQYQNVPQGVYDQLLIASSVGTFVANSVKPTFSFNKIEESIESIFGVQQPVGKSQTSGVSLVNVLRQLCANRSPSPL